MGYTTNVSQSESLKGLFPHIPLLKDNFRELRQWTIRYKTETPEPDGAPARKRGKTAAAQVVNEQPSAPLIAKETEAGEAKKPAFPLKFRGKLSRAGTV
jgi:hypothetical protein